jgi:hypothetical protein
MGKGPRWVARIAGGIVVLLVLLQLLLPRIAAQRMRSELARYGTVRSASISAFPAIELLWGEAQSATMSAADISMSPAQINQLLWKARGVQRIDLHAASVHIGSLTLNNATLRKRGSQLDMNGTLTEADLRASLPGSTGFALLGSNSEGVEMRVKGNLFGVTTSVAVQLRAVEGKLVAQPQGIPFAGLVKITLLSVPHMYVQSIALVNSSAAETGSSSGEAAYQASIVAQLR